MWLAPLTRNPCSTHQDLCHPQHFANISLVKSFIQTLLASTAATGGYLSQSELKIQFQPLAPFHMLCVHMQLGSIRIAQGRLQNIYIIIECSGPQWSTQQVPVGDCVPFRHQHIHYLLSEPVTFQVMVRVTDKAVFQKSATNGYLILVQVGD